MNAGSADDARPPEGGLCLAIDTAGAHCSAAVFDGAAGVLLSCAEPEIGRGHAEHLMDVIAQVLAQAGAGYGDLSRIAVSVGPGSFTGIRVGVSAARALALALSIPCVGVSTLEALAEPHWREAAVLAVQDARRGEVYAALFDAGGRPLAPPAAIEPAGLSGLAGEAPLNRPLLLVGSGAAIAQAALADHRAGLRSGDASGAVAIAAVARLGAQALPGAAVRPLYLREADAKPPSAAKLVSRSSIPLA